MISDSHQNYINLALRRKPHFCHADGKGGWGFGGRGEKITDFEFVIVRSQWQFVLQLCSSMANSESVSIELRRGYESS